MCPNTEFFLVRIFTHSDWMRRDTSYLSVFSPNAEKYGPEKTPRLDTFHAVLICKLFIKRNDFQVHMFRIPWLCCNIFSFIFYRWTLLRPYFLPAAKSLLNRIISHGGSKYKIVKQIEKTFHWHSYLFVKYKIYAVFNIHSKPLGNQTRYL